MNLKYRSVSLLENNSCGQTIWGCLYQVNFRFYKTLKNNNQIQQIVDSRDELIYFSWVVLSLVVYLDFILIQNRAS